MSGAPEGAEGAIGPQRLEAFGDGVIAIILTVMVLELKVPRGVSAPDVLERAPELLSYALSFVVVASMWVNHHHLIRKVKRVDGAFLWLNLQLLFWMSLVPFTTRYAGENHEAPLPVALYGANVCAFSLAFLLVIRGMRGRTHPGHLPEADHARSERKSWLAVGLYGLAVPLAWVSVWASIAIFVLIPALYFFPEKKLEGGGRALG